MAAIVQPRAFAVASTSSAASINASKEVKPTVSAKAQSFFGNVSIVAPRRNVAVSASVRTPVSAAMTAEALKTLVDSIEKQGPDYFNKTYYPKLKDSPAVTKPWFVIDAEGQTLGRLATLAAVTLRGKDQARYSPSMDMGSFVVVINADKVQVSGLKADQKIYMRHTTGRPGHYKKETFRQLQARIPERIVEQAIKGMLPKGPLGRSLFTHLKVYPGAEHPHIAQQPVDITHKINKKPSELAKQ